MSEVTFLLPDGSRVNTGECDRNLNLLAHAQLVELDIGSECGGHGICGKDRLKLGAKDLSLVSPVTEEEREHFSKEELAEGWRLGCQCYPEKSGTRIDVSAPFGSR
jgi:ferredoxin